MTYIFDDLFDEMILSIFSFLSEKDICLNCSLVCKRWNSLSADESLIKARIKIQNKSDLTSTLSDICLNSEYLSFDYISNYVSENYHTIGICGGNFWETGLMAAIGSNDVKLVRRFIKYGFPQTGEYINSLFRAAMLGLLDIVKILTVEYNYKPHILLRCINHSKIRQYPAIIEYLETLQ